MLDPDLKQQLVQYLQYLREPIVLSVYLDGSDKSEKLLAFVQDVASASPKVRVERPGDTRGERVPSFGVHQEGVAPRIKFAGMPLGHEFTSLVLALLHVGGHPPKVSEEELKQIEALSTPMKFETYFSASCQNCPEVVQSLNLMAARNPNIEHVAIDGAFFQDEVEAKQIMAVPTVFRNDESFGQGRMELFEIISKVDNRAAESQVQALNDKPVYDMLVVGGGPAGAAAAIYSARKGIKTGVIADRFGGQVLDTLAIENFVSVTETEGPKLAAALEAHVASYPVDIMKHQRAKKLTGDETIEVELESGAILRSRSVILATGARWRDMNVPGEAEYRTKGVTYCPHCDGPLFKGKRVAVIGGGNSGVEAAIDLAGVVDHVTVLEFADQLKADDVLQKKLASLSNVDVVLQAKTTEVVGDGAKVVGLNYEDRVSGKLKALEVAGIFVQIGLLPNTDWLKGSVELSAHGEIVVDAKGQTSRKGVFAAGDVTTVPFKQIIIATGDGAKAALGAFEHLMRS